MEVKGEPVRMNEACSDTNMKQFWEQLFMIQPNLSCENINKKILSDPVNIKIQQFMESHCSITKYLFQVKKCLSENCLYCTNHPVRLPMDQFKKLSYIPLPLLDGEKYSPFADGC